MARVRFRAQLACDATTGLPRLDLAGLTGVIVLSGTETATDITDNDGLPITDGLVVISASGFTPTFYVEDGLTQVDWFSDPIRVPIDSLAGLEESAAESAADAAQALADLQAYADDHPLLTLPDGGSAGQVLAKTGDDPEDTAWVNPSGSTSGITGAPSVWPSEFNPSPHTHTPATLAVPNVIKTLLGAVDAQTARDAIGAGTGNGTSNLTLGAAGTQAAPGNHAHSSSAIALSAGITGLTATTTVQAALVELAARPTGGGGGTGTTVDVLWSAGAYPTQALTPPAGVKVRRIYGPVQPTFPAWTGVLDSYAYAPLT